VCVCVWLWGGSWWVVVVWVRGLMAGVVCVWCWSGGYVAQVDCYCCHTKQCARCAGPAGQEILVNFYCKPQRESYRQHIIYPLYPTISNYIRLYPIFHHIPSYPTISHLIRPPYPTISHHISISKPGDPKDIRQRGLMMHALG